MLRFGEAVARLLAGFAPAPELAAALGMLAALPANGDALVSRHRQGRFVACSALHLSASAAELAAVIGWGILDG